MEVLEHTVKPWVKANYEDHGIPYVWQQDGAPGHYGQETQDWCAENFQDFWPRDMWPPGAPDLAPLDYFAWPNQQEKACCKYHKSVPALKASVEAAWADLSGEQIRKACASFPRRLQRCVDASGGIIEW